MWLVTFQNNLEGLFCLIISFYISADCDTIASQTVQKVWFDLKVSNNLNGNVFKEDTIAFYAVHYRLVLEPLIPLVPITSTSASLANERTASLSHQPISTSCYLSQSHTLSSPPSQPFLLHTNCWNCCQINDKMQSPLTWVCAGKDNGAMVRWGEVTISLSGCEPDSIKWNSTFMTVYFLCHVFLFALTFVTSPTPGMTNCSRHLFTVAICITCNHISI